METKKKFGQLKPSYYLYIVHSYLGKLEVDYLGYPLMLYGAYC